MLRKLPADKLLLKIREPLKNTEYADKGLFRYAADAVCSLLKKEIADYAGIEVSVYDAVLLGGGSVSEICEKKYAALSREKREKLLPCVVLSALVSGKAVFVCPLLRTENGLSLGAPEKITAELSAEIDGLEKISRKLKRSASKKSVVRGVEKKTEMLTLKISRNLLRSARTDLDFINRFNRQMFFRNVKPQDFNSRLLELSDENVLLSMAELYAMTFFGLSAEDIFTVKNVFSFTDGGVRSKDDARSSAAEEFCRVLAKNDPRETADMLLSIGGTLLAIPAPEMNLRDPVSLAANYLRYVSCAQLGAAVIKAIDGHNDVVEPEFLPAMDRAYFFADYHRVAELCDEIAERSGSSLGGISKLNSFKAAGMFVKKAQGK